MVLRMDEVLYWFETLSGKHPAKPIYSINFRWFGMDRDAMGLVFIGYMSRSQFDKWIVSEGAKSR